MKRIIDIIISLSLLILLMPLILFFCLLIKLIMGSPIFFIQERPGLNGKLFKIIKFRTMLFTNTSFINTNLDIQRTTKLGNFMRNFSIDELPGLFNVLIGNMSIVGPRPLLKEYLSEYTVDEFRRHKVKPGITGWAQIYGRNKLSWNETFQKDLWYVENNNIFLDFKIMLITFIVILRRGGINESNSMTKTKFTKNE